MPRKSLLKEYAEFLVETGLSKGSAACYVSYLNQACQNLPYISDRLLDAIAEAEGEGQGVLCELLVQAIQAARLDKASAVSKKELANYRSAANQLVAFVSAKSAADTEVSAGAKSVDETEASVSAKLAVETDATAGTKPTVKTDAKESEPLSAPPLCSELAHVASSYSRDDLKAIFLSRLKTQDRYYRFGCFPIRIISKIAGRQPKKIDLFRRLIDRTKFLCAGDGSKYFILKDVESLSLYEGRAYITVKGQAYPVYTEVFRRGEAAGYAVAEVNSLCDLSLDHDVPMYDELKRHLDICTEYKRLSDSVLAYRSTHESLPSHLAVSYCDSAEFAALKLDEPTVLKETADLIKGLSLTVMQTGYNCSKNKYGTPVGGEGGAA